MWPEAAIFIPWDIWTVSWIAAALWANRTINRPTLGSEWSYRILEWGGIAMLLGVRSQSSDDFRNGIAAHNPLLQRYWALPSEAGWIMVALAALGFAFCWWARIHLGRLWSGRITRKENHRVVESGPYAFVRHPIYTGVILAAVATAAERGSGVAILSTAMIIAGFWMKARMEERFLRSELGAETYDAYARRTAMLIPFVKL